MAYPYSGELDFLKGEQRPDEWVGSDDDWISNDSNFNDYVTCSLLPDGLFDRILDQHVGKNTENVGLDLAGGENGQALQDLLTAGFLGRALLTTYKDRRSIATKYLVELGHVEGDLIRPDTWQKIINWKHIYAPKGFALIMHRPLGALQDLNPSTYVGAANLLLNMLRPSGVLFTEVPGALYGSGMSLMCESLQERDDIVDIIMGEDRLLTSALIVKA
jgi:hypothetical protein